MEINRKDLSNLYDMYKYSIEVSQFIKGLRYYHFEKDNKTIRAVERSLELIGEAANKISDETKTVFSVIPWHELRGLRNRLAHEYGSIVIFRIWENAKKDIPLLIKELKNIKELRNYIKKQ
jgi:uncharacterized protein with HEPN domain